MNIRFLITATVACLAISAFAQGKPPAGQKGGPGVKAGPGGPGGMRGPGQGGGRRGMPDELKKQLALTAAQEQKIKAISDKYRAKFQALRGNVQPGQRPDPAQMKAMMEKMKPIRDAQQKEIDAVLTPKQRDIMKKWRAAHPPRMMGGPGGPRGGGGAPPPPGGKGGKGGGH